MGTRQIVIKNISANLMLQLITTVGGFILPPLIVATYGSTVNGMVASIKQFIMYLTLLEAGVGAASMVALYPVLSRQDHPLRNRILASTRHFYRISGSLFAVGLLALAALYAWLTHTQISPSLTFFMVLALGAVNVMDFFFCGTYRVLLSADRKTYVVSVIQAAGIVVNVAVSYGLIKAGCSILTVQVVSSAVLIGKFAVFGWYVKRRYPELNLHYVRDNTFKIEQKWDALTHQLCGLVIFSSPLVLITVFLSLKDASVYAVYMLVFAGVKQGLQSLSQGMQAVFGHGLHAGNTRTEKSFRLYEGMFFCLMGWAYTCTAILFLPFISVYTAAMHDADYYQPFLAMMFLLVGFAENIRIPSLTLILAAGHYKDTKRQALLEAAVNIVCSAVLIRIWGLNGLLVGSLISFLYRSNEMVFYTAKRILSVSVKPTYWKLSAVAALSLAGVWIGLHTDFAAVHSYGAWCRLAALTSVVAAVPFAVACCVMTKWRVL